MKPIWVVDDDQSIRFVLEKALTREQFSVRTFSNPRDVVKALDEDAPQVLVSDIRMPGGSGLDLLTKVKEKQPGLPIIIMTGLSKEEILQQTHGMYVNTYWLRKPFGLPQLEAAVHSLLHTRALAVAHLPH